MSVTLHQNAINGVQIFEKFQRVVPLDPIVFGLSFKPPRGKG